MGPLLLQLPPKISSRRSRCTASLSRRTPGSIQSLRLLVICSFLFLIHHANGQRTKEEGCYYDSPESFSCTAPATTGNSGFNNIISAAVSLSEEEEEAICARMRLELFPSEDTFIDVTKHADFLNQVDADNGFCTQMRQAYRRCIFCASPEFRLESQIHYYRTKCGDQLTREQVLASTEEEYADYSTQEDLDATCERLMQSYTSPAEFPRSIALSERQNAIKHLCYSECQNGCFDPVTYPTTCDASVYDGPIYSDLQEHIGPICDYVNSFLFFWFDTDSMSNVAQHADYLRAIPGGTNDCNYVRQGYSQCSWCLEQQQQQAELEDGNNTSANGTIVNNNNYHETCFNPENHPAVCHPLTQEDEQMLLDEDKMLDINNICITLAFELKLPGVDTYMIYPQALHTEHLNFFADTDFCTQARQYYHFCYWCSKHYLEQEAEQAQESELAMDSSNSTTITHLGNSTHDINSTDYNFNDQNNATASESVNENNDNDMNPLVYCNSNDWCSYDASNTNDVVYLYQEQFLQIYGIASDEVVMGGSSSVLDWSYDNCEGLWEDWSHNFYYRYTFAACYEDILLHQLCPETFCANRTSGEDFESYLGADTIAKQKALVWMSRSAAFLSFLGGVYILYDILSNPKSRVTVYHQLLVGMAFFDMVTAVAWSFASTPLPEDEAWFVYGAMGNDATCTAQAFFIQWGYTSMFYNVSLASYYVLVIAYGWRETKLLKVRPILHGSPLLVGLGLALGGIPIYDWIEYACHILPPPDGELWQSLVFVAVPLGISILAITGSMGVVYWKVRQQAIIASKWNMSGGGRASTMERDVFWQCFFYVLAFYITWPIMFAVYLASVDIDAPYGLTVFIAFVAPLQGFSNFLVYIRPKIFKRKRPQKGPKPGFSSNTGSSALSSPFGHGSSRSWGSSSFLGFRLPFMSRKEKKNPRQNINSSMLSTEESGVSRPFGANDRNDSSKNVTFALESTAESEAAVYGNWEGDDDSEYYEMDPSALIARDDYKPEQYHEPAKKPLESALRNSNRSLLEPVMEEISLNDKKDSHHDDDDENDTEDVETSHDESVANAQGGRKREEFVNEAASETTADSVDTEARKTTSPLVVSPSREKQRKPGRKQEVFDNETTGTSETTGEDGCSVVGRQPPSSRPPVRGRARKERRQSRSFEGGRGQEIFENEADSETTGDDVIAERGRQSPSPKSPGRGKGKKERRLSKGMIGKDVGAAVELENKRKESASKSPRMEQRRIKRLELESDARGEQQDIVPELNIDHSRRSSRGGGGGRSRGKFLMDESSLTTNGEFFDMSLIINGVGPLDIDPDDGSSRDPEGIRADDCKVFQDEG